MKIKFTTDEYRTKYFHHGNYKFHVYPYGRGEWTISLYEYGAKQRQGYQEIGYHFAMKLGIVPMNINAVREVIIKFINQ
jgi:hypothetical protein